MGQIHERTLTGEYPGWNKDSMNRPPRVPIELPGTSFPQHNILLNLGKKKKSITAV